MGEYSFDYVPPVLKKREHGFRYDEVQTIGYSFAYGREIQSDTSKFNDLIPAIKTGVRSSYYDDLWLDRKQEAGKHHIWQTVKAQHKDTEYQPGAGFNELYFNDTIENKNEWIGRVHDDEITMTTGESMNRIYSSAMLIDLLNLKSRRNEAIKQSMISVEQTKDLNYFIGIQLKIRDKYAEINNEIELQQNIRIGNINKITPIYWKERYGNINRQIDVKNKNTEKMTNKIRIKSLVRANLLHTNSFLLKMIDRIEMKATLEKSKALSKRVSSGYYDYDTLLGETNEKHAILDTEHSVEKNTIYAQKKQEEMFGIKSIIFSLKNKINLFGKRADRTALVSNIKGAFRRNVLTFLFNGLKSFQKTINEMIREENVFVSNEKQGEIYSQSIEFDTRDKNGSVFYKDYGFVIDKKMMSSEKSIVSVRKEKIGFWIDEYFKIANKSSEIIRDYNTERFGEKGEKFLTNIITESFGEKQNVSIVTDFDLFAQKNNLPMDIIRIMQNKGNVLISLSKDSLSLKEAVWDFGSEKNAKDFYQTDLSVFGYKDSKGTKSIDLKQDVFASKSGVMIDVFMVDSLFHCPSDFFIDCQNQQLKKDGVNGKLDENKWIYKDGKEIQKPFIEWYAEKNKKAFSLHDNEFFIDKKEVGLFFKSADFVNKAGVLVDISENQHIDIDKQKKKTWINGMFEWFKTINKKGFFQNDTFVDKNKNETRLLNQEITFDIGKEMIPFLNFFEADTNNKDTSITDYTMIAERTIKESEIGKTISAMEKCLKDTDYEDRDEIKWAWVYETKDPFDNYKIGIDELLIPENDFRYKDFETILFDRVQMRPKNPIKRIDEKTWIVKYPIKHPLPEYSDIGIEYLDIDTGLMRRMFLEFYRVWQKNIFKFGGMDMVQATSVMLDYMYSWVSLYVPDDLRLEGYRILKMIRWFAESSIIKNSQYVLSYDLEDLKSNLHTGICEIPNEMNNMKILKEEAVFGTVEPGKDAYVEFYVRNIKETTITLSIITTVGTVFIYVNDELVDKITTTSRNLIYQLPYADPITTIRIEKPKEYNKNSDFYIGYVSIADSKPGDLTIKYDPVLKAGNKPMDEIAKKMIELANMYDNNSEVLEQIQKGNLGVSETYKMLKNYWDIHHNNKEKGKRLTIKRV